MEVREHAKSGNRGVDVNARSEAGADYDGQNF